MITEGETCVGKAFGIIETIGITSGVGGSAVIKEIVTKEVEEGGREEWWCM